MLARQKTQYTIAFLGNFRVDYSSETHYLKTFRKMGHNVIPLQEGQASASDITFAALQSDMFFWVHSHGVFTPYILQALEMIHKRNIPTVGYHLDLWLGLNRQKDLETDPYWRIQHFFSVDKKMVDYLNSRDDMPKAYFLPAGVFEDECFVAPQDQKYYHSIVFVGSRLYHPEWPYRKQLIEWLERKYGPRFVQYGNGGRGTIRGTMLNNIYSNTNIVIGDTLCLNFNYPYYLSDRIFETTGRGGFIIHPYIKGIEDLFKIQKYDKHGKIDTKEAEVIVYEFGDFAQLESLIDYFLSHPEERELIRRRGFERTKKDHTYTKRLQTILDTIFKTVNIEPQDRRA